MPHLEEIVGRLPQLYRDGEMVRGVMGVPALQIEIVDEILREVQRAHWFDTALDLEEAGRLAALLDIAPELWQVLDTFRPWVHALRDSILRAGAVTRRALQLFVAEYAAAFEQATRVQAVPPGTVLGDPDRWEDVPSTTAPALIENPRRRVFFSPTGPNLEPLTPFTIEQRGLDPVTPTFLFVGTAGSGESCPLLVNLTTGEGLIYAGCVAPGQRLRIVPDPGGGARALLEEADVTSQLRSLAGVVPGQPWTAGAEVTPPRAITLRPGRNQLWFLPVARFDVPGLDRGLLALPDLTLTEGRWDATTFDATLFYEEPALLLRAAWREAVPAAFEIHLPAQALLARAGDPDAALAARAQLGDALEEAVGKLRAAGVGSQVVLKPFVEGQGQRDRLVAVLPKTFAERGPTGADRLAGSGGVFEVTSYNDSTFR